MQRPKTALDAYRQALDLLAEADVIVASLTEYRAQIVTAAGRRATITAGAAVAVAEHKRQTAAALLELAKLWHGAVGMLESVDETYDRALAARERRDDLVNAVEEYPS